MLVAAVAIGSAATALSPAHSPAASPTRPAPVTVAGVKAMVQSNRLSCASVIAGHLALIDRKDDKLRSVIAINPRALHEARRLDAQPAAARGSLRLLCAPLLVKDNIDVAGLPTTGGSYALRNNVAAEDAAVVAAARQAGAIVIAKTNMSEFALNYRGKSAVRGQTASPYGTDESAGGSSSGNAAALAAGIGIIALGTDTSGSVRVPASVTGTIALRPTFGGVPLQGVMPLSPSQDTVGPMCRHAEDCTKLFGVIAAQDQGRDVAPSQPLKFLRVGILRELLPSGPTESRMIAAIDRGLASLAAAGAILSDVSLADIQVLTGAKPPPGETGLFMSRSAFDFPDVMDAYLPRREGGPRDFAELVERLQAEVREGREDEAVVSAVTKFGANREAGPLDPRARVNGPYRDAFVAPRIRAAFEGASGVDVLLYPSVQDVSFPAASGPETRGTHRLAAYSGYPAIAFPIGWTTDGLAARPVGIELLARPNADRVLLAIVEAWQRLQHRDTSPGL